MMPVFPYPKLSIVEVWIASFRLCCKTFSQVWFLAAIKGVFNILLVLGAFYQLKLLVIDIINANVITATQAITMIWYILALLSVKFVNVYLFAVILYRTHVIDGWYKKTLWDSFCYVNKKYSKIIICNIFACLLVFLGICLFVIPGIYVLIACFMMLPLILFDGKSTFAALKDGCVLVKGNWWRTFTVLFLPLVVVFGFFYLTVWVAQSFVAYKIWCLFMAMGYHILVVTFLVPLISACVLVQFKDLKLRNT